MSIKTFIANLRHAHRSRETVHAGGGSFQPHEIRKVMEDVQLLVHSAEKLLGHTLHYASMPHASSDAHMDAANAIAILKNFKE